MTLSRDTQLDRTATAAELTRAGFPITASALASLAHRGEGPEYSVFGRKTVYRWGNALAWAKGRLKSPRTKQKTAA